MKSKSSFRFLLWIIFGTVIFIASLIFSIAKHERSLRERRERRLIELIQAQDKQQTRLSHIRNQCYHHYGWRPLNDSHLQEMIESMISYLDHLIVDDINQLIYCFVPKVASTNWKRVLLALNFKSSPTDSQINPLFIKGNESHVPKAFKTLNQFNNMTEVVHKLRTYFKFMFVRHPYERLLSAFRNKFENSYSDYFRQRFGRKIVKDLREKPTNESLERGHDITFNEFLTYVSNLNVSDHKRQFNEHWRPVFDLCHPCLLDYDLIGKYETLHSDAQLVLWKARISHLIQFPKREETYSYQPSSDLLFNYYSNISKTLISKLSEVYIQDLELFQYDRDIYFEDQSKI